MQLGTSLVMRRRRSSWRGTVLSAAAVTLWGALILAGVRTSATPLGAAAVWVIAAAIWAGLLLNLRDDRKSRSVR